MNNKAYEIAKIAGVMKDQYIKLLESGVKPAEIQKFVKDIQTNPDPSKVKEPTPSGGQTPMPVSKGIGAEAIADPFGKSGSDEAYLAGEDIVEEFDSEDSSLEPSEDDYILSPSGNLGEKTQVSQYGKSLGIFNGDEKALSFIKKHMKKTNFYPCVWIQDDHGGLTLTEVSTKEASQKDVIGSDDDYLSGK